MFSVNTHELKKSGSQLFDCSSELKTMAIRLGRVSGSLFMGKKSLRKHRKLVEQSLEIVLHVNREGKHYV